VTRVGRRSPLEGNQSTMKNNQAENLARPAGEKNRRLVLAAGLTAASLLFLHAIPAISGDEAENSRAGEAVGVAAIAGRGELPTASELVKAVEPLGLRELTAPPVMLEDSTVKK